MLNCEQFRFLAGADPEHLSFAQKLHRLTCLGCARYLHAMRRFNWRIRQALRLPDPEIWFPEPPSGAETLVRSGRRRPH